MKSLTFMLIAGEASGDLLAAELVQALRAESAATLHSTLRAPHFIGAGGPKMAAEGVGLAFDLTQHSVIGLWEAVKNYAKFKRLFDQLLRFAVERKPDVIIGVDFGGFNLRFARAIRRHLHEHPSDWKPKLVQFVSPQVWASRSGRANQMTRDLDLLISILPFEKAWYAACVPELPVEFVGNPIVDRHENSESRIQNSDVTGKHGHAKVLLLPGSRAGELKRHLPVIIEAARLIQTERPDTTFRMVLPGEGFATHVFREFVRRLQLRVRLGGPITVKEATCFAQKLISGFEIQIGDLSTALSGSTVAIASTGTVTLECAWFGVPTVAIYKTSWATWEIAKRIVQVKYAALPNLLADEPIYPELIQSAATGENIAREVLALLNNAGRRAVVKTKLARVIESLGAPGASQRAARAVLDLLSVG
jgi:lipid-A-disaccharide synthase